jgi:hypothetical protein
MIMKDDFLMRFLCEHFILKFIIDDIKHSGERKQKCLMRMYIYAAQMAGHFTFENCGPLWMKQRRGP